ncbi:MAG: hypothetical protein VX699_09145 [Myxococcota bacterium]|nr:hypothetical protein [Myxococcota bacterium]
MIASLEVRGFSLQAILRFYVELSEVPVAVVGEGSFDGATRLQGVSGAALEFGVERGVTVAQARSRCPEIRIIPRQERLEESAWEALGRAASCFSPRFAVESVGTSGWVDVDLSGTLTLLGAYEESARALQQQVQQEGLVGEVGLGNTRGLARVLARCGHLSPHLPEGAFWDDVPLEVLTPSSALMNAMSRFGINSVGAFLRLPPDALASRVGKEALVLRSRVLGDRGELPLPLGERGVEFSVKREWAGGVDDLSVLLNILEEMVREVMASLVGRGFWCGGVELWFTYEGASCAAGCERVVRSARPVRDVALLMSLCRLHLQKRPLEGPVEQVRVRPMVEVGRRAQLSLFEGAGPPPEALEATVLKLQALCGLERVGSPETTDSHADDAFTLEPFCRLGATPLTREEAWGEEVRGLRRLRPPEACEVALWGRTPRGIRSASVSGPIARSRGPYRRCGHWWLEKEGAFRFDWYDVFLEGGEGLRLHYDWLQSAWWMVGWLD